VIYRRKKSSYYETKQERLKRVLEPLPDLDYHGLRSLLSGHEMFVPVGFDSWHAFAESLGTESECPYAHSRDDGDAWFRPAKSKAICVGRVESHNFRAKEKGLVHDLTDEQWLRIRRLTEDKCVYCGCEKASTLEHFVPICLGGGTTATNVLTSCARCNSAKFKKEPVAFVMALADGAAILKKIHWVFEQMGANDGR
jgi:hypothetical protein